MLFRLFSLDGKTDEKRMGQPYLNTDNAVVRVCGSTVYAKVNSNIADVVCELECSQMIPFWGRRIRQTPMTDFKATSEKLGGKVPFLRDIHPTEKQAFGMSS